jgi:hypothetical protein
MTVELKPRFGPPPLQGAAPVQTMLAILARLASHAPYEPSSITLTQGTHTISVSVTERTAYLAWRWFIDALGAELLDDPIGTLDETRAHLHGWRIELRIVGPT